RGVGSGVGWGLLRGRCGVDREWVRPGGGRAGVPGWTCRAGRKSALLRAGNCAPSRNPVMATDTAAPTATRRVAPDPTQHVWQVPVLLVGVAVFVAAWQNWLPLGTPDPAAAFVRDLGALTAAYERVTPDRDELKDLLAKVVAGVDAFPDYRPAARFALGSGYARLAELTPAPDEARGYWSQAKQQFDMVSGEELKDVNDRQRL